MFLEKTKQLSLEEKLQIISSKSFARLADKSQVLTPAQRYNEPVSNRLTHSHQTAIGAALIESVLTEEIKKKVDFTHSLENACLLHDIGHPPFGHDGAKLIDRIFKDAGLSEGFDDNSNNYVVLEKNLPSLRNTVLSGILKHKQKLYPYQQQKYVSMASAAIEQEVLYFQNLLSIEELPERTIVCEIMDQADENTYTCMDLSDFFSIGMGTADIVAALIPYFSDPLILSFLERLIYGIEKKSKNSIKKQMSYILSEFNKNYTFGKNLTLRHKNEELLLLRQKLLQIEFKHFIHAKENIKAREEYLEKLSIFTKEVISGKREPTSKTYKNLIDNTKSDQLKLRYLRDMVAETTDVYILQQIK